MYVDAIKILFAYIMCVHTSLQLAHKFYTVGCSCLYSETSNNGLSERRTTSVQS